MVLKVNRIGRPSLDATGVSQAVTLAVPCGEEWQPLRRAGLLPRSAFRVQVILLDPGLPPELLRDPPNCRLSGGDFDGMCGSLRGQRSAVAHMFKPNSK